MSVGTSGFSLMGQLLRLSRGERERLAAAWGLSASEATAASLYAELTDPWALAGALERLPAASRQVFAALSTRVAGSSLEALSARLRWRPEEVAEATKMLTDLGLIMNVREGAAAEVVVPTEIWRAAVQLGGRGREPTPVPPPLRRALERLEYDAPWRMARRWGIEESGPWLRNEALNQLRRRMASRSETRRVAAMLSSPARRLLVALHRAGGYATAAALSAATGLDERALRDAAREAREFFPIAESYAGGTRGLVLPVGVGELTDEDQSAQPVGAPRPLAGPSLPPDDFFLACDLLHLLAYLRAADPPVARLPLARSQAQRLGVALSPVGYQQQDDRLAFLLGMAQGLRLIEQSEGGVRPSARAGRWQRLDCAAQTLAIYRWWRETDRWREGLRQPDRDLGGPLAFALGRERLARALAECEPGHWYSEADFLAWVRQREPLLFRDRQALLRAVSQKGMELVARHWGVWDGHLARRALRLSLCWMGLLRYADFGSGPAFAITSLGAWLIGRRDATIPQWPSEPPLQFGEDGQVRLVWASSPALAAVLPYARVIAHGSYRVDAESVARAVRAGAAAERIVADLARHGDLPPVLAANIRQWSDRLRPLRLSRALVLEAADGADLDALIRSPRGAAMALRRLSPTAAVVGDEDALYRFAGDLQSEGYVLLDGRGGSR